MHHLQSVSLGNEVVSSGEVNNLVLMEFLTAVCAGSLLIHIMMKLHVGCTIISALKKLL